MVKNNKHSWSPGYTFCRELMCLFVISLVFAGCTKNSESPLIPKKPTEAEVWLHRCNTVQKAREARYKYPGIELDIHFNLDAGDYFVKHDFETPDTLLLSKYLGSIPDYSEYQYWLDFKNLSTSNQFAALLRLKQLTDSLGIERSRFIVEGNAISLSGFKASGYYTSYYIPYFIPELLTAEMEKEMAFQIREKITNWPTDAISGYYEQLRFMQSYFPEQRKLIWYLQSGVPTTILDTVMRFVKADTNIRVLLLPAEGTDKAEIQK